MSKESANKIIHQHQTMKLTKKDTETFVDAVLNPSEPNEKLSAAVSKYKKIMGD